MTKKTCKRINAAMTDALFGDLPELDKTAFDAHLKTCPACAAEYQKLAGVMNLVDRREQPDMGETFWDNYYERLEDKIDNQTQPQKTKPETPRVKESPRRRWWESLQFKPRWVLYPVAAAAVIVIGVSLGRFLQQTGGGDIINGAVQSIRSLSPAMAGHFDNVRPVLLDYANSSPQTARPKAQHAVYTPETGAAGSIDATETGAAGITAGPGPEDTVMVDRETVKKMLLENRMLRRMVEKNDNITAQQLMDELEVILMEISNSSGDSEENRRLVKQLIKDYDVLFKMKVINRRL